MKISIVYLTRRCPRNCAYCSIRDVKDIGKELTTTQWKEAFDILHKLGVTFNLILGNEPWMLGAKLLNIFENTKVPFGIYTSCPEPLFSKYRDFFFENGIINNLSAGIDYPITERYGIDDDSFDKSKDVWNAFVWTKKKYPNLDTHATITVHKYNLEYLATLTSQLSELGVNSNINFIHWNKDSRYDFCADKVDIEDLLFSKSDFEDITSILKETLKKPRLIQNPEYLQMTIDNPHRVLMGWHCEGDPYGGPTIDVDGTLRCCGYRKGVETPKFTIFDLPAKLEEWQAAVTKDTRACPGCIWSCPCMYHYWKDKDPEMGKLVYTKHKRI